MKELKKLSKPQNIQEATYESVAAEIKQLWAEIQLLKLSSTERGIRIGELFTQEKARCAHGQWLPWLEREFQGQISSQTAATYMRMHEHRELLMAEDVKNITEARNLLAGIKNKGSKQLPPPPKQGKKAKPARTKKKELKQAEAKEKAVAVYVTNCGLSVEDAQRVVEYHYQTARLKAEQTKAAKQERLELEAKLRKQGKLEVKTKVSLNYKYVRKLEKKAEAKGVTLAEYQAEVLAKDANR
jgi:hypothetical protein